MLVCYDCSSQQSWEAVGGHLEFVKANAKDHTLVVIVGMKCDLAQEVQLPLLLSEETFIAQVTHPWCRQSSVPIDALSRLSQDWDLSLWQWLVTGTRFGGIYQTSAKTSHNVDNVMIEAAFLANVRLEEPFKAAAAADAVEARRTQTKADDTPGCHGKCVVS